MAAADLRTTRHYAVDQLRRAILLGELKPGSRLKQDELAEILRISRTPIREALRDLVSEGLVDMDAYRGATVHSPTLEELEDVYETRLLLLPAAVCHGVGRITTEELDKAAELVRTMASIDDAAAWVQLNHQLHSTLENSCRRPRLLETLGRLSNLAGLYIGVSLQGASERRHRGDRDHRALVAAYENADADLAVELTIAHVQQTLEDVRASLTRR